MDFKDIAPYLDYGQHQFSVPLRHPYFMRRIEDLKGSYSLDLNPPYQRDRVWTEDQKSQYIGHILKRGLGGRDIIVNYPDWGKEYKAGTMEVIDGKQRLTTLIDFFKNKVKVFGYCFSEITGNISFNNQLTFYVTTFREKKWIYELYLQLNESGTPHTSEELNKVRRLLEDEEDKISQNKQND
jgi:uncharacterized protein with ParB-like and HNH nuclease domain